MSAADRVEVAELFHSLGAKPNQIARAVRVLQHLQLDTQTAHGAITTLWLLVLVNMVVTAGVLCCEFWWHS